MARQASAADFEAGGLYDSYRRYDFFAARAATIHARYPTGKIGVVGCGWGYLVDELVKLGRDAYGLDVSAYATTKATQVVPAVASRIVLNDATLAAGWSAFKAAAGITGNRRFDLLVSEDILPACSDGEVTALLAQMRANTTQGRILHIITPGDPADPAKFAALNWKSISAWRQVIGNPTTEPILNAETGAVS